MNNGRYETLPPAQPQLPVAIIDDEKKCRVRLSSTPVQSRNIQPRMSHNIESLQLHKSRGRLKNYLTIWAYYLTICAYYPTVWAYFPTIWAYYPVFIWAFYPTIWAYYPLFMWGCSPRPTQFTGWWRCWRWPTFLAFEFFLSFNSNSYRLSCWQGHSICFST